MIEKHYLFLSALQCGWEYEVLSLYPTLIRYHKGDLAFYSRSWISVNINQIDKEIADNKILTYKALKYEGIPMLSANRLRGNDEDYDLYMEISENDTIPVVIKPNSGKGASGVELIKSYSEYKNYCYENDMSDYIITPFYKHEIEVRFLVVNGKVEIIHPKYRNDVNTIRPLQSPNLNIPLSVFRKMKLQAIQVAEKLGFNYVAVDFLVSPTNEFIIIEINFNPVFVRYMKRSVLHTRKFIDLYSKIFHYKEQLLKKDFNLEYNKINLDREDDYYKSAYDYLIDK